MIEKKDRHTPKKRNLSGEDQEIWAQLTRSVKPLSRAQPREPHKEQVTENKKLVTSDAPRALSKSDGNLKVSRQVSSSHSRHAEILERKAPSLDLTDFNKHHARKLRKGQLEIEARIDLHGMRQHEAHSALKRFLQTSFAQGKRWVLVITGKGTSSLRRYEEKYGRSGDEPQRGILKRNVPLWLAEPDLRPLVVSYTEAAIEHGGGGALYVHLRRHSRLKL